MRKHIWDTVKYPQVSLFQGCRLKGVLLHMHMHMVLQTPSLNYNVVPLNPSTGKMQFSSKP